MGEILVTKENLLVGLQLGGWCEKINSSASKYKFLDFQTSSMQEWLETMGDQEELEAISSEEFCRCFSTGLTQ